MEFVAIALFVAGALTPALTRLLNSVAYRNRASGKAEIIRAQHTAREVPESTASGKRGKRRG
ncbi:hypothetical protein RFN57_00105 [Streptomyces violaceochromogenes]|uniref:Uncharacterized protein n=1 Tax=Streptomyces violaceochromogenes TaxID=67377 RepID=A0ABU6LQ26_9ACTN|nr:hypothetical protein [Streptomyces violaceochromogenes]MEC7050737.1 hypothetical protein [Streptomyces violaceochromogenes]GHC94821.1 hypothetical protein GCM10010309_80620 [Streptomyces violaceochromogenes]